MTPEQWLANHSPAAEKYKAAVLADKFGLRPWEIARLTPRQEADQYFHPRDKEGNLKVPEIKAGRGEATTLQSELVALDQLQAAMQEVGAFGDEESLTPENLEQAKAQVRAKYGG